MGSHAPERDEVKNVLEHIAKVVRSIICAAGASTMQSLATSLTRFAKTVSRSVAIALAVALAVTTKMGALKTTVITLIHRLGAAHAENLGLARNVEGMRVLFQKFLQGQFATIAVVLWMFLSNIIPSSMPLLYSLSLSQECLGGEIPMQG